MGKFAVNAIRKMKLSCLHVCAVCCSNPGPIPTLSKKTTFKFWFSSLESTNTPPITCQKGTVSNNMLN